MQHDWFMYHLRSTYKNRLDFPFKRPWTPDFGVRACDVRGRTWSLAPPPQMKILDNAGSLWGVNSALIISRGTAQNVQITALTK